MELETKSDEFFKRQWRHHPFEMLFLTIGDRNPELFHFIKRRIYACWDRGLRRTGCENILQYSKKDESDCDGKVRLSGLKTRDQ